MKEANLRFWIFHNDDYVKLTVCPGKPVAFVKGGRHDEGWSYTRIEYRNEGDNVLHRTVESDGVDCDGRLSTFEESWCPKEELAAWQSPYEGAPMLPNWQYGRSRQRDYRAEAYGY